MKRTLLPILALSIILFSGCQKMEQNKLNRQMKKMAKVYLEKEEIKDYQNLTIKCVDTITEYSYAKLTSELLGDMEGMYEQMYWDESEDTAKREVIGLYLNEIRRTKADFEDLIDNGDLLTEGVLLFMVTGTYQKDGQDLDMMFLVNADKTSLHELDPFSNNLLYKDEE